MEILLYILLTYGISNIVVQSSIFEPLRSYISTKVDFSTFWLYVYRWITCMMCFGFWAGAFVGAFYGPFMWWNLLFNGGLYSGTTWLIHCCAQYLGNGFDPARTINIVSNEPIQIKVVPNDH